MSAQDDLIEPSGADRFLVEQIHRGDPSAWRQLIERYEGRLLAYARARTANLADAEDLVQETFIGFLNSLAHYDSGRVLETYLFTILRHKICDQLRQKRIVALNPAGSSEDWWDQIESPDDLSPSGRMAQAETERSFQETLCDLLRQMIYELRDRGAFDDLQVIELVFFAGKRNLEVADLLEMDQKAVAGVKFRAIQRLHKFLAERKESEQGLLDELQADITVAKVWRERRLTCLKRGTLGSYELGVLDDPWKSYTQFHLDVVGCPMCLANLADLHVEAGEVAPTTEAIFASSIGFLSRVSTPGTADPA